MTLARETLGPAGAARLQSFLGHPVMRALSNTIVAALLGLGMFTLFLTPLFHPLRTDPRSDRHEARCFDRLTDDQLDALNREHLKGPRAGCGPAGE